MRQQLLETMKGKGTVRSNGGEQVPVQYEVNVYQDQIPIKTLAGPPSTIPGLKEYRGVVRPVCFFAESGLLLEMQDGRKLKFFFKNTQGSIAMNEWIG